MKRARLAILTILGVVVVLFVGSTVRKRIIEAKKPPARQDRPPVTTLVEAVPVTPATLAPAVVAYGTVSPTTTLPLVPEVGGRVVAQDRPLRTGTTFSKGDLLWQVDPRDHELAVERVEAEIQRLQATQSRLGANRRAAEERSRIAKELVGLARADVDRYARLAEKGAASRELLDRARATLEQRQDAVAGLKGTLASNPHEVAEIQAQLADARVRLAQAKLTLERSSLRAPFDGRVVEGAVEPGVVLGLGKAAITVEDLSSVEVHVPLTLRELGWAHLPEPDSGGQGGGAGGAAAVVRARGAGDEGGHPARFVRTAGPMDPRTQTQSLVFRIDEPVSPIPGDGGLTAGMFVTVELPGEPIEQAVEAPRRALREDGTVALVVDDKLAFRKVELLRESGDRVFLQGALAAGDLLVVNPPRDAVEGAPVKVRGAAPAVAAAPTPDAPEASP